jgi:lipoprotein-anchoring transpeptidase ErfK/SrfK
MYVRAGSARSGGALTASKAITEQTCKLRFYESSYAGLSGTFVDVNLSTQRLMYIKDGYIVLECDVVTGKPSTQTPTGTYRILSKASPATLVGPGYARPVKYWMPFTNRGHGLHDASWQPWFGGDRWQAGGSMGCVNMPEWAARDLYNVISVGDVVYIHW